MSDEPRIVDAPDPALMVRLLQERARSDGGLAVILEAVMWKALYMESVDIASTNEEGMVNPETETD